MTPEQMVAAQQQIDAFGVRAQEIVQELLVCYRDQDHYRGGELCKEMWSEPNLLMLVIGLLTTMVVDSATGALIETPEGANINPQPWEVGAVDQMEAAAEQGDLNAFASIALDAQIRAYRDDMGRVMSQGGDPPDVRVLVQAFLAMNRVSVTAIAAEALRRLIMLEESKGDG